jgi:S-DNA-T family DNA segregation ATPase FtsK/SpoIIIE
MSAPGTGYVVLDGNPTPIRVRFSYLTDPDIRTLARTHNPANTIDGQIIDPPNTLDQGGAA